MSTLTAHDYSILKTLFGHESSPAEEARVDLDVSSDLECNDKQYRVIRAAEKDILRSLDNSPAEPTLVQNVVQGLSVLIKRYPGYASAYINRAQAHRLLLLTEDLFSSRHAAATTDILKDLRRGIELARPAKPCQAVSGDRAKILAVAYAHRGYLLLRAADLVRNGYTISGVGEGLQSSTPDQIGDLASADFAAAARFGDKTAPQLAARINPYAKMCGAIVKEAMRREMEEARKI